MALKTKRMFSVSKRVVSEKLDRVVLFLKKKKKKKGGHRTCSNCDVSVDVLLWCVTIQRDELVFDVGGSSFVVAAAYLSYKQTQKKLMMSPGYTRRDEDNRGTNQSNLRSTL